MVLNYLFFFFWQSSDSLISSPPKLVDGRLIYYHITDEFGEIDEGTEGLCITFKGNSVDALKKRLEEETGLEDITVCTRSALNGKLYPLRLQLPPNNANMNVIILPSSSKVASIWLSTDGLNARSRVSIDDMILSLRRLEILHNQECHCSPTRGALNADCCSRWM
ncbi:hypothetical protein H5410_025721 [Solanum commersonii]|uniref:DUF569 domain-containing protein n=1 Tax=Solanum commersonii TaxID=4109 RepID=A0A9J5YWN6_SOLCO|nr:hypothetical protein H5410_025721 [Solanum commersonii]